MKCLTGPWICDAALNQRGIGWAARLKLLLPVVLITACSSAEQAATSAVSPSLPAPHQVLRRLVLLPESIADELVFDATLEAVDQSTITAQTNARVEELPFDVGDYVEKGQVIVRFRATEQRARTAGAQAAVREVEARMADAQSAYQRAEALTVRGILSKAALDKAKAALNSTRAQFEAASASVNEAGEQADHTVVRAPYTGTIVSRNIAVGESATVGRPLITALSLEHLRAVVEVPQQAIGIVRARKQGRVILPDGSSVESEQLRIPPSADAQSHTFRVLVTLPQRPSGAAQTVFPGTLVKAAFVRDQHKVLLLPKTAIIARGELTAVYVLDGDKPAALRYVRVGTPIKDGRVPVLAGVIAGEGIALDPLVVAQQLKSGS